MRAVAAGGGPIAVLLFCAACAPRVAPPDAGAHPLPVTVATVVRRDLPIYLEGLGSAVASRTVAVHTLVDGRLLDVFFNEGDAVRSGQLLALVDPDPFKAQLRQAKGALARDQALLRSSRINLERNVALRRQHLVAQQNVDDQRALVGQFKGATQLDRGQIDSAQLNLRYARITAPLDGVAGIRLVDPGNVVHAADASGIVIVTQIDPIAVLFTLPQDDLPQVSAALGRGPLTVELRSRNGDVRLGTGQVTALDNQINQTTATIRLKALAPNPERRLWPNQFVKARLLLTTQIGALVVPATAVQLGPEGSFAWVVDADDTVAMRKVQIALTMGEVSVVRSGLAVGERVVVEGQGDLGPGARVAVRAAEADGGAASDGGSAR
jgi:multidrug efflux system membrane fusion protein